MTPDATVMAVVGGVVAAVAVFGSLLVVGVAIVRRLRLPQDLPDGPRFEPPPPPLRAPAADARTVAERQARLRTLYARGLAALRAAQQCQELAAALPAAREGAVAAPAAVIVRAATAAGEAAGRAERRLADHADLDAAIAAVERDAAAAEAAQAEAEAAAATLPVAGGRRLLLWAAVGVLALVWLTVVLWTLAQRR